MAPNGFLDGMMADEDLVKCVAARVRFMCEAETREINQGISLGESQYSFDENTVPNCGEDCWGSSSNSKLWCLVHSPCF